MIDVDLLKAGAALEKRHRRLAREREVPAFDIAGGGRVRRIGDGEPAFTIVVEDPRGAKELAARDQLGVAVAYLNGWLDLRGDMSAVLALRDLFHDFHPLKQAQRFAGPLLRGQVASDREFISQHYDEDPDFFTTFMDTRHRCYTHAVYERDDESLEVAMTRKMDLAIDAIGVKPGDHVLEVGGGWGAFVEHAGERGIEVTTLTLSVESEKYLNDLIAAKSLPARVVREHVFEYAPGIKYDAIVNMGVTEHLPDYRTTLKAYERLLKPGGRVYLDAVATRAKFRVSTFFSRYIYPGNASPAVLHLYLAAVARSPFRLLSVIDDRANYQRTCTEWAIRFDAAREEVEHRWGREAYRRFRLYLWGSAEAFATDKVQAYRWLLELP